MWLCGQFGWSVIKDCSKTNYPACALRQHVEITRFFGLSSATNIDNSDMICFPFSSLFNLPSVFSAREDGTSCKTLPFIIIIFNTICLLTYKKEKSY